MARSLCALASFLVLFSGNVFGQQFGSWVVETNRTNKELIYAATINDSGNVFGQFCNPEIGRCFYMLGMKTGCEENAKYPVLVNSDIGSFQLEVRCDGKLEKGAYRYVFTDFNLIDDIVKKGARVGFAVPLQSDNFRVIRFDLRGSSAAIESMRAAGDTMTRPASPPKRSTRDQTL